MSPLHSSPAPGRPPIARVGRVFRHPTNAARLLLHAAGIGMLVCAAATGLYLVKSAIGIDILPGPSPLHGLLYPLLGRG